MFYKQRVRKEDDANIWSSKKKKKVRQWLSSNDLEINTEESSFYKGVMFNDMGDMKIFEEHTELHRKR